MKTKNMIKNYSLLLFPLLPTIFMWIFNRMQKEVAKTYDFSMTTYYVVRVMFFLLFMIFVYIVIVNRKQINMILLSIGLVELIILQLPSVAYGILGIVNNGTAIYLYGPYMAMYVLALLLVYRDKKLTK